MTAQQAENPSEISAPAGRRGPYWRRRRNMMYYRYIGHMVRRLAADADILLDVGSRDAGCIEEFAWIPRRIALDIAKPYASDKVQGLRMNFFDYDPPERPDFILCSQVMEHVPEVERFARKLLATSDRVLISAPYLWPENSHPDHVHDRIDLGTVARWFGRAPDHHVVVTEPFVASEKASRIICYFQSPLGSFSLQAARKAAPDWSRKPVPHAAEGGRRPEREGDRLERSPLSRLVAKLRRVRG